MFNFFRFFIQRIKSFSQQIPEPEVTTFPMPKEKIEVDRLEQAVSYNTSNVPIFAPNGFPSWSAIQAESDTEEFVIEVARAQKHLGLKADGFCGPSTIDALAEEDRKNLHSIIIGPKAYPVSSPVITYHDDDPNLAGLSGRRRNQKIRQICLHYDVTFNSMSTLSVLKKRGLSYNFLIDGDEEATIYQTHNPTLTACFHAGAINNYSVGICINNPADTKYQKQDEERREGRRREKKGDTIHGARIERLTFFDEQLAISKELVSILCAELDIPFKAPRDKDDGAILKGVVPNFEAYSGVLGHYHVSPSKTDPSPLDWNKFLGLDKD